MNVRTRFSVWFALATVVVAGIGSTAHAQYYWDTNGATAGAGGNATGTWSAGGVTWSTSSAGTSANATYTTLSTDNVFFVAGPAADSGNATYTVTLSGSQFANSLNFQASGNTTITGGALTLGNGTAGAGGINLGQFAYGATPQGAVTISTALTLANNQTWTNNSTSLLTVQTGALTNGGFGLTVGGTGNTTVSSVIGGAGGLTKSGTGTLTLSGASNFTGGVTMSAGTASFTSTGLGSASAANKITFAGNSTLQWGAATTTDLSSRLIINNGVTATLDTGANNVTFGSVFGLETDSKGTLNKTGSGILTLGNTVNQFAGNIVISGGRVALGGQYSMWQSAYDTTGSTGAIGLNVTGQATPWLGGLAGSVNLATAITGYGSVTALTLNPQAGSSVSYGGVIANGSGNMTLSKTGLGTQALTGANSYSGATTVWAGTLALSGASGTALNSAFTVLGGTLELDNSTNLVASRLADGTAISLGSLTLKGFNTGGVQGETVGATTFAVGGKVTVINGSTAGDRTDLTMGAVNRSTGAAIDFVGGGLGTLGGGAGSPNVTSTGAFPNIQNNILPWATVGGTQWAENNAGSVRAFTGSFTTLAAATNTTQAQQTGAATLGGALNTNSLNVISDGSSNILALGGNTISFGSTNVAGTLGAILKSGTNPYTISGGTIRVGTSGAGTELISHVDGGALTISANLNTNIVNIAKGGTGDLILSGTRAGTFSGNTSIAGGQLEFQGAGFTISGVVTGAGGLTINLNAGQTLTLINNSNSYSGQTIVKGGYLANSAYTNIGLPGGNYQTPPQHKYFARWH